MSLIKIKGGKRRGMLKRMHAQETGKGEEEGREGISREKSNNT